MAVREPPGQAECRNRLGFGTGHIQRLPVARKGQPGGPGEAIVGRREKLRTGRAGGVADQGQAGERITTAASWLPVAKVTSALAWAGSRRRSWPSMLNSRAEPSQTSSM